MPFERLKQIEMRVELKKYYVSPEIIDASHIECRKRRINPDLTEIPKLHNHFDSGYLIESSKHLLSAAWPVIKDDLYPCFVNEDQLIILCNHEGYAIALMSSPKVLDLCYGLNISVGSCFSEKSCGTNAIALAMQLKNTVVIRGEQHYCQLFKDWSCVAAPVWSPSGDIVGYFDVSMDTEDELGHTVTLVQFAVNYIEKMFEEKYSEKLLYKENVLFETIHKFGLLSPRERQIISLIGEGQTESEIAATIEISRETVKTHREKIYKKLGVNKKSDCLKKARELELLD